MAKTKHTLQDAAPDLLASCKELRESLAVAMQIMAGYEMVWNRFEKTVQQRGIANGVGVRADAAIVKAEKSVG